MEPQHMPTEDALRRWRHGHTNAERLAAQILLLEGFTGIDPQTPTGGPDGTKDLLCERGGMRYVAACYFPSTEPRFREVRKKFTEDLAGAVANGRPAIVFVTGQFLTPSEREELVDIARSSGITCELLHGERLRVVLDSPLGLGARTEYLRIPPTPAEMMSGITQLFAAVGRMSAPERLVDPQAANAATSPDFDLKYIAERVGTVPHEKRHYIVDGFVFGVSSTFLKATTAEEHGEFYKNSLGAVLSNLKLIMSVGARHAASLVEECSRECGDPGPGPAFKMCVHQVLTFEALAKACGRLMKPGLRLQP